MTKKKDTGLQSVKKNPNAKKVMALLAKHKVDKDKLCEVILEGLNANKTIIAGGRVIQEPDHAVRHKFLETVLDILGERKLVVPAGELHYHFTSVLQQIRAYETGDKNAIDAARQFTDISGSGIEGDGSNNSAS